MVLGKNNTKEIEEEVIAECYDDVDDTNDNSGSDSLESEEENDKPDPKVLDKFKVSISYINSINITLEFEYINFIYRVIMVVQISQTFITNVQSIVNNNGETV